MRGYLTTVTVATLLVLGAPALVSAAEVGCPAEIGRAKELLNRKGGLRAEEPGQPARSLAGARKDTETIAGTQWTGKLVRASQLVREAEAACKAGDLRTARAKAVAAVAELD
jgi:hypothetical protein